MHGSADYMYHNMAEWLCDEQDAVPWFTCGSSCERGVRSTVNDKSYCSLDCRYPPCASPTCTTKRPRKFRHMYHNMVNWLCEEHDTVSCFKCGKTCGRAISGWTNIKSYCSDACQYPPCASPKCRTARPQDHAKYQCHVVQEWYCKRHR